MSDHRRSLHRGRYTFEVGAIVLDTLSRKIKINNQFDALNKARPRTSRVVKFLSCASNRLEVGVLGSRVRKYGANETGPVSDDFW